MFHRASWPLMVKTGEPVYQRVKMSNTHLNPIDGSIVTKEKSLLTASMSSLYGFKSDLTISRSLVIIVKYLIILINPATYILFNLEVLYVITHHLVC